MHKGDVENLTWILVGPAIILSIGIVIYTTVSVSVDVAVEYPEASAIIGSYSLLNNVLSEECLGTDRIGVLDRSKLESETEELSCLKDNDFSYYVKTTTSSKVWEFGQTYDKNSLQKRFSIVIRDSNGNTEIGEMLFVSSYKTDELILLLASCADRAFVIGQCKESFNSANPKIVTFNESKICVETACLKEPCTESICTKIKGEFEENYEKVYNPKSLATISIALNESKLVVE